MPQTQSWGGAVTSIYTSYWTGDVVYRDSTGPIPTAQVAANGKRPITIHSCSAASLSNGSPEVVYQGQPWSPGRTFADSTPGGAFRFQVRNTGGGMAVGRSEPDGGTIVDNGDGDTRVGSIPGSFSWSGAPSPARTVTATASASVAGRITVGWSAPSTDGGSAITGYDVYLGTTLMGSTAGLSLVVNSLNPGESYTFTVRAKNAVTTAAGTTAAASSSATAVARGVPTAPQFVTSSPVQSTTTAILAEWIPEYDGNSAITGFTLQLATNSGFTTGLQTFSVSSSSVSKQVTGLTPGTTYYARVRATNALGDSPWSVVRSRFVAIAPSAPTLSTLAQASLTSFSMSWTTPASNGGRSIDGYRIQYATNASFSGATTLDIGVTNSRTISGLAPGRQYWVRVAAKNAVHSMGAAFVYSASSSVIIVAEIGNLDGWASYGSLPAGLTPLIGAGLRRGQFPTVVGTPTGLIREIQSSGSGSVAAGALGIQRTMTGLKIGNTYRLDGKMVALVSSTPPGNIYRWAVVGIGAGTAAGIPNPSSITTIPSYTFVATATSHVVQIQLYEAASWSGAGYFENTGFYQIKLYEIPNVSPYRLQDTAYEGPLASHFSMACNTVGASWWVDRENVTQFRQADSQDGVLATFTDKRAIGKLEYTDIGATYNTRDLVNILSVNNHGRDAGTGKTDDATTAYSDTASVTAWGARSAEIEMSMRRTTVFEATNLAPDPEYAFSATPPGLVVVSPAGGTYTFSRITSATNDTPYAGQISVGTAPTAATAFRIQDLTTGLQGGDPFTLSFLVWSSAPMTDIRARVYAYQNADGSGTQYTFNGVATAVSSTAVRVTVSGVMPAGTLSARPAILINTAMAAAQTIRLDNVILTKTATQVPFFDGATASTQDYVNAWSGTPHASSSTRGKTLTAVRAEELLASHATPAVSVRLIRWNAQEDPELAAHLDIQDRVRVEFLGVEQDCRIVGLKHTIKAKRWMVDLALIPS